MIAVYVSAPLAAFRSPHSREYLETLAVPPPSTVYGMLLSLVGESRRTVHAGAELALVTLGSPQRSVLLRTSWRIKDPKAPLGSEVNKRPDLQEVLSDVRLVVFVRSSCEDPAVTPLADRVAAALHAPGTIERFGALALGESTFLVDEVRPLRDGDLADDPRIVRPDPEGDLVLSVWADHVGSAGTRWQRFSRHPYTHLDERDWIRIVPPQ